MQRNSPPGLSDVIRLNERRTLPSGVRSIHLCLHVHIRHHTYRLQLLMMMMLMHALLQHVST